MDAEDGPSIWEETSHAALPPWFGPPKDDKLEKRAKDVANKLKSAVASARK